ncbi:MAG TPA: P63C domain-containing protein [Flavobacteriales bacterium]
MLKGFISEELLPWVKTFPNEFYKQLFRLRGWPYDPVSVKRPSYVGKLTNALVYDRLSPEITKALKAKTPKSKAGNYTARFFQSLTKDVGYETLRGHLQQVIILMKISPNWTTFQRNFARAFEVGQQARFSAFTIQYTQRGGIL